MKLIDGEHGRRRIVDGRRERLDCYIHDDAKGEHRILLESPLVTYRNRIAYIVIGQRITIAIDPEQWIARGNEVSDLRNELDDAIGFNGLIDQPRNIKGEGSAIFAIHDD